MSGTNDNDNDDPLLSALKAWPPTFRDELVKGLGHFLFLSGIKKVEIDEAGKVYTVTHRTGLQTAGLGLTDGLQNLTAILTRASQPNPAHINGWDWQMSVEFVLRHQQRPEGLVLDVGFDVERGARVLLVAQDDPTTNGPYVVEKGEWLYQASEIRPGSAWLDESRDNNAPCTVWTYQADRPAHTFLPVSL